MLEPLPCRRFAASEPGAQTNKVESNGKDVSNYEVECLVVATAAGPELLAGFWTAVFFVCGRRAFGKRMSALKAQYMASILVRTLWDNQTVDPLSVFAGHVQATADDCLTQIRTIMAIEQDTTSPGQQTSSRGDSRGHRGSAAVLPPLNPCGTKVTALSALQVKLGELLWCIMQMVWSGGPTHCCWDASGEDDTVAASEASAHDLEVYLTELISRPLQKWQRLALFRAVDALSDGLEKLGERLPWKEAELASAACQRALGAI